MATAEEVGDPENVFVMPAEMQGGTNALWDPILSKDWDQEKPTEQCYLRIKR